MTDERRACGVVATGSFAERSFGPRGLRMPRDGGSPASPDAHDDDLPAIAAVLPARVRRKRAIGRPGYDAAAPSP